MNYDNEIDEILDLLKERREREKELENSSQEDSSAPLTFSSLIEKNQKKNEQTSTEIKAVEADTITEPLPEPEKNKKQNQQKKKALVQAEIKVEPEIEKTDKVENKIEFKAEVREESKPELTPPKPLNADPLEEENTRQKRLVWYDSEKELIKESKKKQKLAKKENKEKIKIKFDFSKIKSTVKSLFSKKEKSETKKSAKEKFKSFSSTVKTNFKNKILPVLKKIFTKQLLFAILIIAALTGMIFGGVKLYEYSKIAYLKPYQEKYDIEYPEGILEEFCEVYGRNQHIKGKLIIEDTGTTKYIANQIMADTPYLKYECDVNKDEHFRTIDVSKDYADLESIYSTTEGFLNSTQKITFNTLFEKADYKVVAAFYTNTNADDDNGYVFPYNVYGNMTNKSYYQFIDRIKSRRLYDTGYLPKYEDYILTLSVDSDFMKNFKFVVVCVKNTDKKFEKSDIAKTNSHIHYPQIWYNKNKQENPYRYAQQWYPEIYTDNESTQTKQLTIEDFK